MKTPDFTTSTQLPKPHPDDIALAAYHLYVNRGGQHGHAREDWLSAEQALCKQLAETADHDTAALVKPFPAVPQTWSECCQ